MENDFFYITSSYNKQCLVIKNYVFSSNKRIPETQKTYWRCTRSSSRQIPKCTVRCTTTQGRLTNYYGVHNHSPQPEKLKGKTRYKNEIL